MWVLPHSFERKQHFQRDNNYSLITNKGNGEWSSMNGPAQGHLSLAMNVVTFIQVSSYFDTLFWSHVGIQNSREFK